MILSNICPLKSSVKFFWIMNLVCAQTGSVIVKTCKLAPPPKQIYIYITNWTPPNFFVVVVPFSPEKIIESEKKQKTPMVSMLLSASVERFSVSHMQDFYKSKLHWSYPDWKTTNLGLFALCLAVTSPWWTHGCFRLFGEVTLAVLKRSIRDQPPGCLFCEAKVNSEK